MKKKNRSQDPMAEYRKVQRSLGDVQSSSHSTVLRQEARAAEIIGGRTHAASGASPYQKSDCSSAEWQGECKQTQHASLSLKQEWLDKISVESMAKGRQPFLHVRFLNAPIEKDWVMIPERVFRRLLNGEGS